MFEKIKNDWLIAGATGRIAASFKFNEMFLSNYNLKFSDNFPRLMVEVFFNKNPEFHGGAYPRVQPTILALTSLIYAAETLHDPLAKQFINLNAVQLWQYIYTNQHKNIKNIFDRHVFSQCTKYIENELNKNQEFYGNTVN